MKKSVRNVILFTAAYAVVACVLLPAGACWLWGRSSLIRLDPQVSRDYNCIFVEGHTRNVFAVPWLSRSTPLDYLRIRYTPHAEHQEYGIMFVDPKTMAFASFPFCAKWPSILHNRLDSPTPVLDWMRSQPASTQSVSHTNDASEVYAAIQALSQTDLEHFALPTGFALHGFVLGHHSIANDRNLRWWDGLPLVPIWIGVLACKSKTTELNNGASPNAGSAGAPPASVIVTDEEI
jgi:hypothetical protein